MLPEKPTSTSQIQCYRTRFLKVLISGLFFSFHCIDFRVMDWNLCLYLRGGSWKYSHSRTLCWFLEAVPGVSEVPSEGPTCRTGERPAVPQRHLRQSLHRPQASQVSVDNSVIVSLPLSSSSSGGVSSFFNIFWLFIYTFIHSPHTFINRSPFLYLIFCPSLFVSYQVLCRALAVVTTNSGDRRHCRFLGCYTHLELCHPGQHLQPRYWKTSAHF